jgi:Tfp pilus assembly protein PilF
MIKSKWILVFIIPLLVVGCRNEERAREAKLKYSLGVSYFQERKLNEAREAFEKAVQLNPKYYEARLALSNVYFEMQRGEDAIREIKKAIRIEPTKAQPHQLLSHIYFSFGRFDDVLEELERAIVLEPGNPGCGTGKIRTGRDAPDGSQYARGSSPHGHGTPQSGTVQGSSREISVYP